MTTELQRLLDHVRQRHGSAVSGARVGRILEAIDKIIAEAVSSGFSGRPRLGWPWPRRMTYPFQRFSTGNVNDEQQFRQGVLALVRGLDLLAQHDVLLEAAKRALTVAKIDNFQWFLVRGPGKTTPEEPSADTPTPTSLRPSGAPPPVAAPAASDKCSHNPPPPPPPPPHSRRATGADAGDHGCAGHPKLTPRRPITVPSAPRTGRPQALHPSCICITCGTWNLAPPASIGGMACPVCSSLGSIQALALQLGTQEADTRGDPVLAALRLSPPEAQQTVLEVIGTWVRVLSHLSLSATATPPPPHTMRWHLGYVLGRGTLRQVRRPAAPLVRTARPPRARAATVFLHHLARPLIGLRHVREAAGVRGSGVVPPRCRVLTTPLLCCPVGAAPTPHHQRGGTGSSMGRQSAWHRQYRPFWVRLVEVRGPTAAYVRAALAHLGAPATSPRRSTGARRAYPLLGVGQQHV